MFKLRKQWGWPKANKAQAASAPHSSPNKRLNILALGHPHCSALLLLWNAICIAVAAGSQLSNMPMTSCLLCLQKFSISSVSRVPRTYQAKTPPSRSSFEKTINSSLPFAAIRWVEYHLFKCYLQNCGSRKHEFSFNYVSYPSVSEHTNSSNIHPQLL